MVELGESDVPLTEDIVKKPPREFSPTLMEWAAENLNQIFLNETLTGNSIVMYVVPDNFTLFITSASVAAFAEGVNEHGMAVILLQRSLGGVASIIQAALDHEAGKTGTPANNSISFPMPLLIRSKDRIVLTKRSLFTGRIEGTFMGFLLPKRISIR